MRISKSLVLIGTIAVLATPRFAGAQGMPLDYTQYYYQPGQKMDPMYKATGTNKMPEAQRFMSTYASRVEAEGKVEIARKDIKTAIGQLDKLANDPKLATKVLGKGWRVKKVGTWDFNDVYRDNKTFDLAKAKSGFRVRRVNGGKAETNVKPPGGIKSDLDIRGQITDSPNGRITRRVEFGTKMHARASLRTIAGTKSKLNPLAWVSKMMKKDPVSFVPAAIAIHQDRVRYVLQKAEGKDAQGKTQWNPLVDLSVDDITATLARGPKAKRKSVKFASIEMDLNHPGSGSGLVIATGKWAPPHRPSDLKRSAFMKDEAVGDLHRQVPKLLAHIGVKAVSADPKYTAAAVKLGLIKAPTTRARKTLSSTEQTSVKSFLKKQGWTTNAAVKVIGQSRSGRSWRVLVTNNNGGKARKVYLHKKTGDVFMPTRPAPKAQQARQAQRNSSFMRRGSRGGRFKTTFGARSAFRARAYNRR